MHSEWESECTGCVRACVALVLVRVIGATRAGASSSGLCRPEKPSVGCLKTEKWAAGFQLRSCCCSPREENVVLCGWKDRTGEFPEGSSGILDKSSFRPLVETC